YVNHFQGGPIRQILYRAAFRFFTWLIRPIIADTIEGVVTHLRKFLKNDVDLLHFVERKVGDMADYYGRIEKARNDYTQPNRTDECGTFDNFLKETIKVYGQKKLTEEQLSKILGDYIVENFVPRPNVQLFGHRIPLISNFLEWVSHKLRKGVVRHVMKKSGIIPRLLTQGTDSVHYAQLGLKRLLEQKLTQVCEMVTRSRTRAISVLNAPGLEAHDPLRVGPAPAQETTREPPLPRDLEAKKAQIITRQLHLIIQQHSAKLLRFIDIEACNGDEIKLKDLDNRVSALVAEAIAAIGNVFQWEPFSLRKVLEDASTHAMETALLALFEDKERQIEEQLHTIFDVLDKSYAFVPEDQRAESERVFKAECAEVDQNLSTLQEQLSRAAVAAALESHLKNVSGPRHTHIKDYVKEEKELYAHFIDELTACGEALKCADRVENIHSGDLKTAVSKTVALIEQYLSHISAQLRSPELEACYSDVKGDLHNIYAAAIVQLNVLHTEINKIASAVNEIKKSEDEMRATQECEALLENFPVETDAVTEHCKTLQEKLPSTIREELMPRLEAIVTSSAELKKQTEFLGIFGQRTQLEVEKQRLERKQALFVDAERKLNQLKQKIGAFRDENTQSGLLKEIRQLHGALLNISDLDFKREIAHLLKAENTTELRHVFYPSFFASHVPIFSNLAILRGQCQDAITVTTAQIASLAPDVSRNSNAIMEAQQQCEAEIEQNIAAIRKRIIENRIAQTMAGDAKKVEIASFQAKAFGADFALFQDLKRRFAVKGCISVGEMKLYNRLAPELTARIAPKIVEGTRTLIDAMGKPFHYKQLVLRLLFLDIADRHTAAKEG
ncbi:hypothetical protein ACFLR2_02370, partial [Chlamydiota bacterium]